MLNFLDKTTLSYASIMGFREDLSLKGDNYEWLGSIFYIGYLAWEFPTSRLLQRLPLGKYSAINIILWGTVLCCTAACTNFAGAVAVRFLLGVFEASVTPGFALFTSQWYTQEEQAARIGIWFGFNGIAQIVGGAIASGIARGVARTGAALPGWKIIFVAIGLLTVTVGVLFLFLMPDNQMNARFLNEEEKVMAIERIRGNQQGVGSRHFKWYQFQEAFTDPMTWAFMFHGITADIPNGGVTSFFSILVKGFGFTSEESLLYGGIGGAVQIVTLVTWGVISTKYGHRVLLSALILLLAILGMLLVVCLPTTNAVGRLIGYYLAAAQGAPLVCLLSLISANVAGYTKKTTVASLYLVSYCAGNIIGPQTFREKDAPRYLPAEITIIACWGSCVVNLFFISWYYKRQNIAKEAQRAQAAYEPLENAGFFDLTDRENPEFHYVY